MNSNKINLLDGQVELILDMLKQNIKQIKESRYKTEEDYKKINMAVITYEQILEQYNEKNTKRKIINNV